jgi:hypothetical protein
MRRNPTYRAEPPYKKDFGGKAFLLRPTYNIKGLRVFLGFGKRKKLRFYLKENRFY